MRAYLFALLLLSASYAFTIESYQSDVTVLDNGDLQVHEKMVFELEEQYNEGYRSIRPADAPSLEHIEVDSVTVNGKFVDHHTQVYGGYVEVVWTETYEGTNEVELEYVLKDKVELFDDFARTCYEHFGANWAVPARTFTSRMTLPDSTRGTEMHFEIYSTKKGEAYVDDLTIVTEVDDVPSGNYIGGCYLFDRDSVVTDNAVEGSAYEILQDERESYGSVDVFLEEPLPFAYICFPIFLIFGILAGQRILNRRVPKYPESILPPGKEHYSFVAALLRKSYPEKDLMAATIIDLINRGVIDIVELEKQGEKSAEMKRERTILILKRPKGLTAHEQAVIDMIFQENKREVDLDALAEEYKKINSRSKARATHIEDKLDEFKDGIHHIIGKRYNALSYIKEDRMQYLPVIGFMYIWCIFFFGCFLSDALYYYSDVKDDLNFWVLLVSILGILVFSTVLVYLYIQPSPPKENKERFERWDAFARGLKSSRIKEYPPSSALIWGEILVYATALGLADKVKRHLSELDTLTMRKIERMQHVATTTYVFYKSANGTRNLSKYGNRGGFKSSSSGGWSSSGGGGFSSGSSGGGGFR